LKAEQRNCLYIEILWVHEDFLKKGYGTALLKDVEQLSRENGCILIHLDTFDFQAKAFYEKHGYEVFVYWKIVLRHISDIT
jgi:GNAT superfamily N-acetyltransferase